jgi:hypothetical protein
MQCIGRQLVYSPSDLSNFLACEHLTQLEVDVALQGGAAAKRHERLCL